MTRKKKSVVQHTVASFKYTSECCNAPAKKPALVKTEEAMGTLGHWRCSKCERPTKVKRSKLKENDGTTSGTETGT